MVLKREKSLSEKKYANIFTNYIPAFTMVERDFLFDVRMPENIREQCLIERKIPRDAIIMY